MTAFDQIRERLLEYGQVHLLKHWDEISEEQRRQLKYDIEELKLEELSGFFKRATDSLRDDNNGHEKLDDRMQPIPDSHFLSTSRASSEQKRLYEEEGLRQVAAGHVGVLLMAGGQGTRLGFQHPKGMFNVGLPSQKSLFQIQAERIRSLQRLAKELTGTEGRITWYIMTSEHTMEPTLAYFKHNDFFGLHSGDVKLFKQGSLPCFAFDGKILLDDKHKVSRAPDGNGGIYRALRDQGVLAHMRERGIRYLHAHSVDNILIKVADPLFVGYCVSVGSDCAAKVILIYCCIKFRSSNVFIFQLNINCYKQIF